MKMIIINLYIKNYILNKIIVIKKLYYYSYVININLKNDSK
jgi:hypothetical protein